MSSSYSGYKASSSTGQPAAQPSKRVPTDSSYYSFDGQPSKKGGQPWMYARDARQQVDTAASPMPKGVKGYPSYYGNKPAPGLPLLATAPVMHIPLLPGQTNWQQGNKPGAWRAFYNDNDRTTFDVGFHDPKKGKSANGSNQFSLGNYHPKA